MWRAILKVVPLPLQVASQCQLTVMKMILKMCVRFPLSLVYIDWYSSLMNAPSRMCPVNFTFVLMLLMPLMPEVLLLLPGTPVVALRVLFERSSWACGWAPSCRFVSTAHALGEWVVPIVHHSRCSGSSLEAYTKCLEPTTSYCIAFCGGR
ncbi:unnamed protein product [Prorocentrum cordatum]|uniref:Secreted protein n=1 Tax=Prorocentrum cordatum TaxID=2364126 RepID=A0ABN9PS41_9DINO|nr:unnamed protein product [Polarella glacialis]